MTKEAQAEMTNWEAFEALSADDEARTSDRFQAAGTYANCMETTETTDEEWAKAFFDAYNTDPQYLPRNH